MTDVQYSDLAAVFRVERPSVVIHHAAQAEVRRSVEDPRFDADVNILGAVNLLECCRSFGVQRVRLRIERRRRLDGRHRSSFPTPEVSRATHLAIPCLEADGGGFCLACWADLYGIRGLAFPLRQMSTAPARAQRARRAWWRPSPIACLPGNPR